VCGCVLVYARTHTQTTWVLDVSPGVGRTLGEPEESRLTKAQYTCRPYHSRCTKYICLYRVLMIWAICLFFFQYVCSSSFEKSRRCDDNYQTTVTHFGENERLHLESSKQNYYIVSFMSNNKSNLRSCVPPCWWPCSTFRTLQCLTTKVLGLALDVHVRMNTNCCRGRVVFPQSYGPGQNLLPLQITNLLFHWHTAAPSGPFSPFVEVKIYSRAVKETTSQNLWPGIHSLIKTARSAVLKNRAERDFVFAVSAAKFWKDT